MTSIEHLEPRIAPASILTFTDVDGDEVIIKSTVGNLVGKATFAAVGIGSQLRLLTLTSSEFSGANISIVATKSATGDGFVDVGYVNAKNCDLGKVIIDGDLGRIESGDTTLSTAGLKSLTVRSLGRQGLATQGLVSNLDSIVVGGVSGLVKVLTDVRDASFSTFSGGLGSLTIGRSLIGSSVNGSGQIQIQGDVGAIKIGRDIIGGAGESSGTLRAVNIASISIGGSLLGGVGGPPLGGMSGAIFAVGNVGSIKIAHDIVSSGIIGSGDIIEDSFGGSASILAKRIASITIGGSIVAASDDGVGTAFRCASIQVEDDIGSLTVRGSIVGNEENPVLITARGKDGPNLILDTAIGRITIGGSVQYAKILAGYDRQDPPNPISGNASIGTVRVGGDWIASSLVAGARDFGMNGFGNGDDQLIGSGGDAIIARIASITINGIVLGSAASGDHFGFVAQQIGAFKAAGTIRNMSAGSDIHELAPVTGDVSIREI